MFKRQTSGSTVCRACARLVGVNDETCFNCGAKNPALWGYAPILRRLGYNLGFVPIVLYGCISLYLLTLLYDPAGIRMGGLFSLFAPSVESLFVFGASGMYPVFVEGRWWTILSAAWLHGGFLHIFFNLMWIRHMAPATAEMYGASRLVIIYTVSSATGFLLSSIGGNVLTIGASAPIFGLFAALIWAGRRTGNTALGQQAFIFAAVLFMFGFAMPGIDNLAHLGGFIGGFATCIWLDPLKEETFTDLVLALLCVVLIAASLLASVALALL
jgi:rhomboid protease GluP